MSVVLREFFLGTHESITLSVLFLVECFFFFSDSLHHTCPTFLQAEPGSTLVPNIGLVPSLGLETGAES